MNPIIKRYWAIGLILLFSCELIVDINVPYDGGKLTLNSLFTPDSVWRARLTLNRYILDDSTQTYVDDAVVTIEDETGSHALTSVGNGVYIGDRRPDNGKKYRITAHSSNYGSVSASSDVPIPVEVTGAQVSVSRGEEGYLQTHISVTFDDPLGVENYYQFIAIQEYEIFDRVAGTIITERHSIPLITDDPLIDDQEEVEYFFEGINFRDALFDGKTHTLKLISDYILTTSSGYSLALRSISKDYYQYLSTVALQRSVSGDPLAQPVNVHNNIEHGFGVFAGYSKSAYERSRPKPVITSLSTWTGKPGDQITIYGENLEGENTEYSFELTSVDFWNGENVVYASVIETSPTQVTFVVPESAVTGKIIIRANQRYAISDEEFHVIR